MRHELLTLLLVPLLAACPGRPADAGASLVTDPAQGQPTVELAARPLAGGDDGGGRVTAEGGARSITVQGALSTPNPCYTLSGAMRRDGAVLTLTVEARATDGMCIQSIGAFAYDATVRGLEPGAYTFRVIHTYPGTGWETRPALDTRVTVR